MFIFILYLLLPLSYSLEPLAPYGTFKDLKTVNSYQVPFNKAALSRNGSQAQSVKKGDVIQDYGMYYLYSQEEATLIKFSIAATEDLLTQPITNDADLEKAILFALEDGNTHYTLKVGKSYKDLKAKLKTIHKKLTDTYPLIDYMGYEALIYSDRVEITYKRRTTPDVTYQTLTFLDNVIKQLDLSQDSIEREKQIVRFILNRYHYDKSQEVIPSEALSRTVQGAYLDKALVCSGYAKLAQFLFNVVGIPTQYVVGRTTNGQAHAWNIVKLDNGYYHVDLTWADSDRFNQSQNHYVDYINEKDTYMAQTHIWDQTLYPACNQNTYLNTSIYTLPVLNDQLLKIDFSRTYRFMSTDSTLLKQQIKRLANLYGKPITYYTRIKYNSILVKFNSI